MERLFLYNTMQGHAQWTPRQSRGPRVWWVFDGKPKLSFTFSPGPDSEAFSSLMGNGLGNGGMEKLDESVLSLKTEGF